MWRGVICALEKTGRMARTFLSRPLLLELGASVLNRLSCISRASRQASRAGEVIVGEKSPVSLIDLESKVIRVQLTSTPRGDI